MSLGPFRDLSLCSKVSIALGAVGLIYMYAALPTSKIGEIMQKMCEMVACLGIYAPIALSLICAICVVACFPFTLAFELAAGFMFGILGGFPIIAVAKLSGGLTAFHLSRTYLRNFVYQRINSSKYSKLYRELSADSLKLAIMLRLSPCPSWIINYGLALTPITYKNFTLATILAGFPGILRNVYIGSIMKSLVGADESGIGGWSYYATGGVTIVTSVLVTRYVYKYFKLATSSSEVDT